MQKLESSHSFYHQLDLNRRLDPLLHSVASIRHQDIQRIASLAMPFINLYQPASMGLSVLFGGAQVWTLSKHMLENAKNGEWQIFARHGVHVALMTTGIALSILMPIAGTIFSGTLQIGECIFRLSYHLKAGHYKEAAWQIAKIAHQLIYMAAVVYAAPELLLASLLAQALVELYRCYQEWQRGGHAPESLGHLLMAMLRLYQASSHAQVLHRNYFGHQIKQEDVKVLLADIKKQKSEHPEQLVDFEKILIDHYYSSKIRNISFQQETSDLTHIFFKNMSFANCDFSQIDFSHSLFQRVSTQHSNFSQSTMAFVRFDNFQAFKCDFSGLFSLDAIWNHCRFEGCNLQMAQNYESIFNDTHFENSNLTKSGFYRSIFNRAVFKGCGMEDGNFAETIHQQGQFKDSQLSYLCFNSAKMDDTSFVNCQLNETSFFDAQVKGCRIKDSDLTDCLLLDNKDQFQITGGISHRTTKPVIGLLWNFKSHGPFTDLIGEALKDCGATVLRFDYRIKELDKARLEIEVQDGLARLNREGIGANRLSIADALLKDYSGQAIEQVKAKTEKVASYIQGVLLPGGDDVEPEFYGQQAKGIDYEDDYQRSLFEFGLISQALAKKLPLQGICRGSQIVNVFMGGTLKQHVDDHMVVVHPLKINEECSEEAKKWMQTILEGDQINGLSMHHQASDRIGKGLNVVLEHEEVPEALISEDGNIVLTQFHPESYLFDQQKGKIDPAKLEKFKKLDPYYKVFFSFSFAKGKNFFSHLIKQASLQPVA
ncbi:gamma-glutamyl-gamma-aminobutyrate hydrolase family protein [Candidatus Protochlamydia phocaeensis]|uniref:gamma-glutamyl-gamma-aminobutyrate hydrolase family protein n=1 Tax=Candidatus Protochlamydia phocaeensis TaxID=1414722 RepID=UPI0008396D88|nr:gamma-glutamyl-gamma-aminobutyrate hydrolase family protein [Candidatus Protochlamydia phocaeensis]